MKEFFYPRWINKKDHWPPFNGSVKQTLTTISICRRRGEMYFPFFFVCYPLCCCCCCQKKKKSFSLSNTHTPVDTFKWVEIHQLCIHIRRAITFPRPPLQLYKCMCYIFEHDFSTTFVCCYIFIYPCDESCAMKISTAWTVHKARSNIFASTYFMKNEIFSHHLRYSSIRRIVFIKCNTYCSIKHKPIWNKNIKCLIDRHFCLFDI